MKTKFTALLVLAFSTGLMACTGLIDIADPALGANGGQLQKGEKCATCTGPVPLEARVCSDNTTSVGSECLSQGDGTCGYDFPACPGDSSPGSKCTTCTGPVPLEARVCSDNTTVVGSECLYRAGGTCSYDFPACPGDVPNPRAVDASAPNSTADASAPNPWAVDASAPNSTADASAPNPWAVDASAPDAR